MEEVQFAAVLSGEHPTFPLEELRALCAPHDFQLSLFSRRMAIIGGANEPWAENAASRIALSHALLKVHCIARSRDELDDAAREFSHQHVGEKAAVRTMWMDGRESARIAAEIGSILSEKMQIDLSHPDVEVRIIEDEGKWLLATVMGRVDRKKIDARDGRNRIFSTPVSLRSRYARAFLNVCGVFEGCTLIDPFCGTGGILIEAALLGAKITGCDVDQRMIEGTRRNLQQFGIGSFKLRRMDIGSIGELGEFDFAVTDLPYGRSSSLHGEDIVSLYSRAMKSFEDILPSGGKLGMIVPDVSLIRRRDSFRTVTAIQQRVHRSLTRNFVLLERL